MPDSDAVEVIVTGRTRSEEFSAFMARAQADLGRMAWLLTGDRHRAEELVQSTLVKTYAAWERARRGDPLVFARRVLVNARIDSWRRHRREWLVEAVADATDGTQRNDALGVRDELVRALRMLPAQRRRVVVLRYLLDLSEREVAEELGISVGAVKSAASRGVAELRARLTDHTDLSRGM